MILLSLLKQLELDGFGTLHTDDAKGDLFYEVAPLGKDGEPLSGMWIVSRTGDVTRFNIGIQPFDIYTRYSNKLEGGQKALEVLEWLQSKYDQYCELPAVEPYFNHGYSKVILTPVSGVNAVGLDDQNRMVYVISGEVRYNKNDIE